MSSLHEEIVNSCYPSPDKKFKYHQVLKKSIKLIDEEMKLINYPVEYTKWVLIRPKKNDFEEDNPRTKKYYLPYENYIHIYVAVPSVDEIKRIESISLEHNEICSSHVDGDILQLVKYRTVSSVDPDIFDTQSKPLDVSSHILCFIPMIPISTSIVFNCGCAQYQEHVVRIKFKQDNDETGVLDPRQEIYVVAKMPNISIGSSFKTQIVPYLSCLTYISSTDKSKLSISCKAESFVSSVLIMPTTKKITSVKFSLTNKFAFGPFSRKFLKDSATRYDLPGNVMLLDLVGCNPLDSVDVISSFSMKKHLIDMSKISDPCLDITFDPEDETKCSVKVIFIYINIGKIEEGWFNRYISPQDLHKYYT